MEDVSAFDILRSEHRVIERIIPVLNAFSKSLEDGRIPPTESIENIIDFIQRFVDKCHHGKEELGLFPVLESKDQNISNKLRVLSIEHEFGRRIFSTIKEYYGRIEETSFDAKALARHLHAYAQFLAEHIRKEEETFDSVGAKVLGTKEQEDLRERFERIEVEKLGHGAHQQLIRILENTEASVR